MNVKKYLQQQAEKDIEALLSEKDRMIIEQLVQNHTPAQAVQPAKKKSKTFWAVLGSVATVIVAAVIVFPAVFVNRGGDSGGKFYADLNIEKVVCQFEDMQANLKYFKIEEKENPYIVYLNYDSISGDKLFYTVDGSTSIASFKFYVIVNENYNYNFEFKNSEELKSEQFDYVLNYSSTVTSGFEGDITNYSASIELQTEIIYIDYQQLFDLGEFSEQAFFDDITSIIKVKN